MTEPDVRNLSDLTSAHAAASVGFEIRTGTPADHDWTRSILKQFWASTQIVSRGRVRDAAELPRLVAWHGTEPVGLLTYEITAQGPSKALEIVTHNAVGDPARAGVGGIGTLLLAAAKSLARAHGCARLWLVTTNDNTPALRFYQRREFDLVALHRDAIRNARSLKPEMPEIGLDSIPVRHELELEFRL
jgi:GNAT superfamily N-acetyltransferase